MPAGIQISEFSINLGFVTAKFKVEELDQTLASLVDEMRSITSDLTPDERGVLRRIMASRDESVRVHDLFPDRPFVRGDGDHRTLRKLRDAQFIRPSEGGQWQAGSLIKIKPFGRLMWDKIGEDKLFAKGPST